MELSINDDFEMLRKRLASFPGQVSCSDRVHQLVRIGASQISDLILLLQHSVKAGFKPPIAVIANVPDRIRALINHRPPELTRALDAAPTEMMRRSLYDAVTVVVSYSARCMVSLKCCCNLGGTRVGSGNAAALGVHRTRLPPNGNP